MCLSGLSAVIATKLLQLDALQSLGYPANASTVETWHDDISS
jgi:hypothetical protein